MRAVLPLALLVALAAAASVAIATASERKPARGVEWWRHRAQANRRLYRVEHKRWKDEHAHRLRDRRARTVQAHVDAVGWPWVAIADCESGDGDGQPPYSATWDYNGSSGFDGGVQFEPGTWAGYRHDGEPERAYDASPATQVAVAERVLAAQGWGAWPDCSLKVGLR